jgi:hypothetical protein
MESMAPVLAIVKMVAGLSGKGERRDPAGETV